MKSRKEIYQYLQYSLIILLLFGANIIRINNVMPIVYISKQQSSLNFKNSIYKYFNLGNKRLISSILWAVTILESDTEHYKKRDLNSWMFLRFKTISQLEPKFLPTYTFGGPYLSIIKDDIAGASIIYDLGLKEYPNSFELLKNAAFHFHYEVKDFNKSYEIYKKLKIHPETRPILLTQLAKLEIEKGNLEVAFELLKDQYESLINIDSPLKDVIKKRMYSIRAEIDLNCLNNLDQKERCNKTDLDGNYYTFKNGKFDAIKEWQPFR